MSVAWYWPDFQADPLPDDPYRQSTTACCPRQTIPDSCECPDGCDCLCNDCDCRLPEEEDDDQ